MEPKPTTEALYLLALLDEPGWTDATEAPKPGLPPRSLRLVRGAELIEMELRFNNGNDRYFVRECPERFAGVLADHAIRPVRRRE